MSIFFRTSFYLAMRKKTYVMLCIFNRKCNSTFVCSFTFVILTQWANSQEKAVCRSVFLTMALYFECRINKNALIHTVFLAIYPLGNGFFIIF